MLVCWQDYTKSYRWTWLKFSEKARLGPSYWWLDFGGDPDQRLDSG